MNPQTKNSSGIPKVYPPESNLFSVIPQTEKVFPPKNSSVIPRVYPPKIPSYSDDLSYPQSENGVKDWVGKIENTQQILVPHLISNEGGKRKSKKKKKHSKKLRKSYKKRRRRGL